MVLTIQFVLAMEKKTPLLPFAFNSNSFDDNLPLNTAPRHRSVIDQNAGSSFHTRTTEKTLTVPPRLKRKMGASFNENDDTKRRGYNNDFERNFFMAQSTSYHVENSSEPLDEATIVDDDFEDGDFAQGTVAGDKKLFPPSSPNLMSEFDASTSYNFPGTSPAKGNSHELNTSPIKDLDSGAPTPINTSPVKKSVSKQQSNLSSDADFGIDKFNRFRSSKGCISSDFTDEQYKRSAYNQARQIILDSFEEINPKIHLENLGLWEIPDEIKDMNNLVIFNEEPFLYQLYLGGNKLRSLPLSLIKFTKLNVLSVRHNKLEELPPIINKLQKLTDLNIGSNRIKFLPWQFLELSNLKTFGAGPNPFLPVTDDAIPILTGTLNNFSQKKYVSKIKYFSDAKVPLLKALCLNKLAHYDVSYQDTKAWKKTTNKVFHGLIIKAIEKGKFNDVCCECDLIVVEPVAEVFEWWDILLNKNIPIRRQFCSGKCVLKYKLRLIEDCEESTDIEL